MRSDQRSLIMLPLALCLLFALAGCELGLGLATPTPTPEGHGPHMDWNSPSLDLRVFKSDAVVWVKPHSGATSNVETVPSDPGVKPTYLAYIEFKFEVIEYLKGGGLKDVAARWSSGYTQARKSDAQKTADRMLTRRDTEWEDREAVLFLQSLPDYAISDTDDVNVSRYSFMEWSSYSSRWDYRIDGEAKTWLPARTTGASEQSNASPASKLFLAGSEPAQPGGELPTASLSEIRTSVNELAETMEKGKGIEGYEYCVYRKLFDTNEMRDLVLPTIDMRLRSGLPAGNFLSKTRDSRTWGRGYGKRWLSGPDASLFIMKVIDGEGRSITDPRFNVDIQNYATITSARPLVAGLYKFYEHEQFPHEMPCNFIHPENELPTIRVTVTAPTGAIHEAFFDPVKLPSGIGADKDNGVLKPTSFTVNGGAAKIERIAWMPSGAVEIEFKPSVSLAGHVIEFIERDGAIALRLDFDETLAGSGLAWQVCNRPWNAGDLLMIRISEKGASDTADDSTDGACPSEEAEQS